MKIFGLVFFFIFSSFPLMLFAQQSHQFVCGDARVDLDDWGIYESSRSLITVTNQGKDTKLWLRSVDYFGAECQKDAKDRDVIFVQAYCSGSGCTSDSYGIIEPSSLRIRLVPTDGSGGTSNKERAKEILGREIIKPENVFRVGEYE